MRTFLLSTSFAAAMGAIAMAPANAAPIATHGVVIAPAVTTDVACRTVKKVVYRNGVKRVTTTQQCTRPRNRVVVRPGYRRPAVGIGVRIR